ncbi:MAG: hypothetical protein H8D23_27145 [Candidatus Brocadiales bacterium]|nr:hypothetical protein [Candidatus Brocadiales bacterium]
MPEYIERRRKSDPLDNLVDEIALYYRQKKMEEAKNKRYVQSNIISSLVDIQGLATSEQIGQRIGVLKNLSVDQSLVDLVGSSVQTLQAQQVVVKEREDILERSAITTEALNALKNNPDINREDIENTIGMMKGVTDTRVADINALTSVQKQEHRYRLNEFEKETTVLDFLLQGDDETTLEIFENRPPEGLDKAPASQLVMDIILGSYQRGDVNAALRGINQLQKINVEYLQKQNEAARQESEDAVVKKEAAKEAAIVASEVAITKKRQELTTGIQQRRDLSAKWFNEIRDYGTADNNVQFKEDIYWILSKAGAGSTNNLEESDQKIPDAVAGILVNRTGMAIRQVIYAENGGQEGRSLFNWGGNKAYTFLVELAGGSKEAMNKYSTALNETPDEQNPNPHYNALFTYLVQQNPDDFEGRDLGSEQAGDWFNVYLEDHLKAYEYRYGTKALEEIKSTYGDLVTAIKDGEDVEKGPFLEKLNNFMDRVNSKSKETPTPGKDPNNKGTGAFNDLMHPKGGAK